VNLSTVKSLPRIAIGAVLASALCIVPLNAAIIETSSDITDLVGNISTTDLADSSSASFGSISVTGYVPTNGAQSDPVNLVDGTGSGSVFINEASNTQDGAYSVTINFDISSNTLGYDIEQINTLAGVAGHGGTKLQTHDIYYSVVGDAGYTLLHQTDLVFGGALTSGGFPSLVTLFDNTSDPLATGVDSIRFDISETTDGANLDAFYHEFDVLGQATIPEPTTLAIFGLGFAAMMRRRAV